MEWMLGKNHASDMVAPPTSLVSAALAVNERVEAMDGTEDLDSSSEDAMEGIESC